MIIETCPVCGHDLINIVLASNPPIPKKECWSCGWSWTGDAEEVIRVPFGGNKENKEILNKKPDKLINNIILNEKYDFTQLPSLNDYLNECFESYDVRFDGKPACDCCPNNPKNGGSGICFCTLGSMEFMS